MKISAVETFIVHAPVKTGGIRDSTHSLIHWGVPGVKISAEGAVGWDSPAPTRTWHRIE
jgi:hypothetical protein